MNVRKEMEKWVDERVEEIQHLSDNCPEFDKLYELKTKAPRLFYELFHPIGIYDDGLYGFYKTFHPFHHYWYDDGEMCIAHITFKYSLEHHRLESNNGKENLVLPMDVWDTNNKKYYDPYVVKHLLTHRPEWNITVTSVTAVPFRSKDWLDFLVDTMVPLYNKINGRSDVYYKQRDNFDKVLTERIQEMAKEWWKDKV